jgi:hypothetical protein
VLQGQVELLEGPPGGVKVNEHLQVGPSSLT